MRSLRLGGRRQRGLDILGGAILVLVHLVLLDEVVIVLLIIVFVDRVLLGGLGEVNHLAASATADDVVEVDLLHVVVVSCNAVSQFP